jgi:hypothetical protein
MAVAMITGAPAAHRVFGRVAMSHTFKDDGAFDSLEMPVYS